MMDVCVFAFYKAALGSLLRNTVLLAKRNKHLCAGKYNSPVYIYECVCVREYEITSNKSVKPKCFKHRGSEYKPSFKEQSMCADTKHDRAWVSTNVLLCASKSSCRAHYCRHAAVCRRGVCVCLSGECSISCLLICLKEKAVEMCSSGCQFCIHATLTTSQRVT